MDFTNEQKQKSDEIGKRAVFICSHIGVAYSIGYSLAKSEESIFISTGKQIDITKGGLLSEIDFYILGNFRNDIIPKICDELKIELTKHVPLENEPSKFFGKSKRNYKK